ncbi:MAG TPA: rRNA maturation RNase YbeY [Bacteroidales bacterium]|nr:rRNA maturation RNase YbeY [Bacteroidales bacterium]
MIERIEHCKIENINFIFMPDRNIRLLNIKYLNHHYPTDVITFDYSQMNEIGGDIFIGLHTVKYYAHKNAIPYQKEIYRVMVHGVLHLAGYKDKSIRERNLMRRKEDFYLRKLYD